MANGSCQLGGYILSLLAGICAVIAVGIPYWSRDTHNGQVIEAMGYSYGLWWRCVYVSTGHFTCDAYDRIFLGMPAEIQTARGLSVVGCLIWLIMMVMGVFGLNCTTWRAGTRSKSRITVFSGIGCIIAGICVGVAASMWAYRLVTDFYGFATGMSYGDGFGYGSGFTGGAGFGGYGSVMEPGASVWLCWFSCVCLIVGGLLMICGSRNEDDYDEDLTYRPRNDPSAYRTPKKNFNNYNTNTNGGRNNPGFVTDAPSNYHRNTNLPNRVYI